MKNTNKTLTLFLALACAVSSVLPAARMLPVAKGFGQIGLKAAARAQLPMQVGRIAAQIPQTTPLFKNLGIPAQAKASAIPTFKLPAYNFMQAQPAQKPAVKKAKKVVKPTQAITTTREPEFEYEMPEAAMDYLEHEASIENSDADMPIQTAAEEASDLVEADLIEHTNTRIPSSMPESVIDNTETTDACMPAEIAETAIDTLVEHKKEPMPVHQKAEISAAPEEAPANFHDNTSAPTHSGRPNNPAKLRRSGSIKPSNRDIAIVAGIAALSVSIYGLAIYAWAHKDSLNACLSPKLIETQDIDFSARKKMAKPQNSKVTIILDKSQKKIFTAFNTI